MEKKPFDKLRNYNIKTKRIKIGDARIRNSKMFQEDQGMFYRKTQGMKQLKEKVPKMEKLEELWAGIWEGTNSLQRKWMNTVAKKIGIYNCGNSQSPKRSCTRQSRNERNGSLQGSVEYRIFGGKSLEIHGV